MSPSSEFAALYRRDLLRLVRQHEAFPDTVLWRIAPGVTNSAGNLMLHLHGNLRAYVGKNIGGVPYERDRPREFSAKDVPRAELATTLTELAELIPRLLSEVPPTRWDDIYPENVLGEPLSHRQFVVHLYGHLGYHLGQIDYLRRVLTGHGALAPATKK